MAKKQMSLAEFNAHEALLGRLGGKGNWVKSKDYAVYTRPDDPTASVVVFHGSPGVSVDGKTEGDYAVVLEMRGQGGLYMASEGIASDYMDVLLAPEKQGHKVG